MRELKLVEPPDINSLYNGLLLEGEKFWSHDFRTLNEILDCLNVVKVTNRLPSCFWERSSVAEVGGFIAQKPIKSTTAEYSTNVQKMHVCPHFGNTMLAVCALLN